MFSFSFLPWAQAKDTNLCRDRDHMMPSVVSPDRVDNYHLKCLP